MESQVESRYSYGLSFRFESGRLAKGLKDGNVCPWPVEYASQVFHGQTGRDEDPHLVALVGRIESPECAISIGPAMGSFGATFPDGPEGWAPSYSFYSADVSYPEQLQVMSEQEREARSGQMFNVHVEFESPMGDQSRAVKAMFRPDGMVRLVIGPFGDSEVRDWVTCPSLDIEMLWLPVPEFNDYRSIEVRERPILDVVRALL